MKEMSSKEGFEIFQKLYFDTCKRQKYFGHTKEYHEVVWNSLKDGIAHILIAFYEDSPLRHMSCSNSKIFSIIPMEVLQNYTAI